jgi:hypothetical protein
MKDKENTVKTAAEIKAEKDAVALAARNEPETNPAVVDVIEDAAPVVDAAPVSVDQTITRDEVSEMITAAVAAALASVARSEPVADAAAPVAVVADPAADPVAEATITALSTIARSMGELTDRLAQLEGSTVARSDGQDAPQTAEKPDLFVGIFGKKPA